MSKLETPMTEGFWMSATRGAFIPEYPLIPEPGPETSQRWADAVILPDEPHGRAHARDYPSLMGRNVIMVQTKAARMGMYLMGQAVFSAGLVRAQGAASVRSILLCSKLDRALIGLLKPFPEVEVWLSDLKNPMVVTRADVT